MELHENTFTKCSPAIRNNLKECGSVGLCDAIPLTEEDLGEDGVYQKSGDFRVLDALLQSDFEIAQCGANQMGLYDFLMSQKVNMSHKVTPQGINGDIIEIAPFIKADQYSPINNEFWLFNSGEVDGDQWVIRAHSDTGIPADVRSFPVGKRIFLFGAGEGGVRISAAGIVAESVLDGDEVVVTLDPMTNSNFDADKVTLPEEGYLRRGTNNVSDYEKNCDEAPAYLNNKMVPFWMQHWRWSYCNSEVYDEHRAIMRKSNALYRKFFDLPETKRNQQLMMDAQKTFVNQVFYGKPLANQNMADYDQLETIEAFDASEFGGGGFEGLGVEGGVCVGKRAEAVGILEQLAECGRVFDLLGAGLNLPALFAEFYNIVRVREGQNNRNRIIDVFTDTNTARKINRAMIKYYAREAQDENGNTVLSVNVNGEDFRTSKKANFGFYYQSYPIFTPQGVTMNVITHYSFDDEIEAARAAGVTSVGRNVWVLDFTGIYPGIIASNKVVAETGKLKQLAAINPDFACVMKVKSRRQTLMSMSFTTIVECPFANLVLENVGDDEPSIEEDANISYSTVTTTTTTSV